MTKHLKYIFSISLLVSISLNILTITLLKNQSSKIEALNYDLNRIVNSTNGIENTLSTTHKTTESKKAYDIMSPTQLAEYLNIDIKQIYKSIIENPNSKFPYIKINDQIRFSKKAIDQYMLNKNSINERS